MHKFCTLGDFLRLGKSPGTCGNLLDSPATHSEFPPFVPQVFPNVSPPFISLTCYPRPLSSCAEAVRLTKNMSNAKVPICAHQAVRLRALAALPSDESLKPEDIEQRVRMTELMEHMKAEATADAKNLHDVQQKAWKARLVAENKVRAALKKEASSTADPQSYVLLQKPTAGKDLPKSQIAGMREAVEVPPIDNREWCTTCAIVRAYLHDEDQRVREAEDADDSEHDQGKRIYRVNPLSHDDQHAPMAADSFNQTPPDCQHMYQECQGIQTYSMDAFNNARWDLFTHTGFHTWPHHDASGMSTWVLIRFGCKVWCPVIPHLRDSAFLTQYDLFDAIRRNLRTAPSTNFHDNSQSICMFLLPHDVL